MKKLFFAFFLLAAFSVQAQVSYSIDIVFGADSTYTITQSDTLGNEIRLRTFEFKDSITAATFLKRKGTSLLGVIAQAESTITESEYTIETIDSAFVALGGTTFSEVAVTQYIGSLNGYYRLRTKDGINQVVRILNQNIRDYPSGANSGPLRYTAERSIRFRYLGVDYRASSSIENPSILKGEQESNTRNRIELKFLQGL